MRDIQKIKKYLAKKPRDAPLFSFGINTGLRISDILSLDVGVKERIGTHTLRKTFGYHHYKKYNDIVLLIKNL